MSKIIVRFSLLVALVSIIIFANSGDALLNVLLRALTIFFVLASMFSLLALFVYRSINKISLKKEDVTH